MVTTLELNALHQTIVNTHGDEIVKLAILRHFTRRLLTAYGEQYDVCFDGQYEVAGKCIAARLRELGKPQNAVDDALIALQQAGKTADYISAGSNSYFASHGYNFDSDK